MDELYGHRCDRCGGFSNAADMKVTFSPEALTKGLEEIFKGMNVRDEIQQDIFRETLRLFNLAAAKGISEAYDEAAITDEFLEQIRHNNEVFSAFRTHRMQNDIAKQLLDDKGQLKPFYQFKRDVEPLTGKYCDQWLNTEYNTAVIRAHRAAEWKHFETEKDVYPNLRWMPTTSVNPDPVHESFWSHKLTLPIDDPFWSHHQPGERWNCKCSCEQTDEPVNDLGMNEEIRKDTANTGLHGNPAETGKLFSEDHPYYAESYPGAKKAVESVVSPKRKQRTQEESERIREAWKERKEIIRIAEEWAKPIPFEAIRKDAESAARIMMNAFGKDYSLPRISIVKEKGSRGRILHHHASYSDAADLLKINTGNKDFIKDYIEYKRKAVEMGWSSQRNTILHELSHQLHSKFDKDFQMHIHQGIGLDKKYVEKYLSQYGATDRGEYEAELISGILSGKKYPDKIIANSLFARIDNKFGKTLIEKGRDFSPEGRQFRKEEKKSAANQLESWYKSNLPETPDGRRFKVVRMDGEEIIVNQTFYKEVINKSVQDISYTLKLEKAQNAHKLIQDAKYVRTEQPRHEKHIRANEVFKVYERTIDDITYEFKVKENSDGKFLYYMRIK